MVERHFTFSPPHILIIIIFPYWFKRVCVLHMPDVFLGHVVVLLNKGIHSPLIYRTVLQCKRIISGISSVIFHHGSTC